MKKRSGAMAGFLVAAFCALFFCAVPAARSFDCGAGGTRVLVTYDTKYNSTADVAALMGIVLCARGFDVSVLRADCEDLQDISAYDAVIIGSPIYYGVWLKDARAFLERHQETLSEMPVAYFITSNLLREGYDPAEDPDKALYYYVNPVLEQFPGIEPMEPIGNFGGKLEFSDFTPFEWVLLKLCGYYDNDSRDWDAIAEWADEISANLGAFEVP